MALDIVKRIKDTVLGIKSNKIDNIIDTSIDNIDRYSQSSDQNKFLDAMKKLISTSGADGSSLLKSLSTGTPQVQHYDNSGRIARYAEYDAICAKIPYCERALQCWVDHIVSPDEILRNTFQICAKDPADNSDSIDVAISRVNTLIKHFDLENRIRSIIKTTLKKGDNFIEIVKTPKGANSLVVLNEHFDPAVYNGKLNSLLEKAYVYSVDDKGNKSRVKIVIDEAYSNFNLGGIFNSMGTQMSSPDYPNMQTTFRDVTATIDSIKSKDSGGKKIVSSNEKVGDDKFRSKFDKIEKDAQKYEIGEPLTELRDVSMVIHDPKYVIRLETKRFRVCLGYLVFPKVDLINVQSGVVNNIDAMCAQLLSDVKQKLNKKVEIDDKINITDDIKKVLLVHLQHIEKNDDLRIRYVNPDLMQHFKLESDKYTPYGESIFDSVLFNCRMYMALKTSCLVKQINASTDKRFISLEIGIPRDAKNVIEQMKESINKKRITIDSLGNTDTIPSQISTWENIFIPMKDGKKYVEVDHQQWSANGNDDAEQLKQQQQDIIGNLGVPPNYLDIVESGGNRATLTAESINFARGIIARQQDLTPCLYGFIYKCYCLIWGHKQAEILNRIQITFQVPRIAPMSVNIEFVENSSRAIEALAALGVDKEYLKKQYMPYIDWTKVSDDAIAHKLKQETGEEESAAGGGMDMGGLGMMPTGGGMDMGGGM